MKKPTCPYCGAPRKFARTCGAADCQRAHQRALMRTRMRARRLENPGSDVSDRPTTKICEACGDVFLTRRVARFCSQKCNASLQDMFERSAQGNAALAEKLRATLKEQREDGSWAQHSGFVFTRDDYTCWLCGEGTSESFSHRDLLSPTLDHVIPRSLGGGHDPENLRTAHWLCNSIRGHHEEVISIDPSRVYERALL